VVVPYGYATYNGAYNTTNNTIYNTNSANPNNTPNTTSNTNIKKVHFDFTYDKRNSPELTTALFNALLEICLHTPGGVVVFCTSFSYLDALLQRWRSSKLLYKLDAVKRVFAESRSAGDTNMYTSHNISSNSNTITTTHTTSTNNSNNTDSDHVWEAYKTHLTTHPAEGGILFSVINGKLSEGINFSDYLARCVVVVGMPYPDTRDVVLQEKMRYVTHKESHSGSSGGGVGSSVGVGSGSGSGSTNAGSMGSGSGGNVANTASTSYTSNTNYNTPAGRSLCENMCMRAVNQSVGRAIRHINDYACVVLLDRRYAQEHMRAQLPRWLTRGLQVCSGGDGGTGGGSVRGNMGDGDTRLGDVLKTFFEQQIM